MNISLSSVDTAIRRWHQERLKPLLRLFSTGFAMGAADLVPGVSGGTIAFIMGIYEELIESIKTVSGKTLQLLLARKWGEAIKSVPWAFLIPLALGLATAIVSLSSALTFVLAEFPVLIWSFFFGLVLASILVVSKRIVSWNLHDIVLMALAAAGSYVVMGLVPQETSSHSIAFFFAGFIAICAMILPGISGSFLLLVMGKYEQILAAISNFDLWIIFLVGSGAIIGLAIFSRVLSWLFAKHHDVVIAILTGFMIGSLRKVWPYKEIIETRVSSSGEIEPIVTVNYIPTTLDWMAVGALLAASAGVILIYLMSRQHVTDEVTDDLADPEFTKRHRKALRSQKN